MPLFFCLVECIVLKNFFQSDLQRTSESSQVEICLPQEYMELQNGERCILSPDVCFVSMLRYGLLALHLLPENCTSGICFLKILPSFCFAICYSKHFEGPMYVCTL